MSRLPAIATIAAVGAAIVLLFAFLTGRFPFTEMRCGTGPLSYKIAGTPWVIITEEYSCGVSSQWTEVRASNQETNEQTMLLLFDDIEEFSFRKTPLGVKLTASDIANVVCYRSKLGASKVTYDFSRDAPRYSGATQPAASSCLSTN